MAMKTSSSGWRQRRHISISVAMWQRKMAAAAMAKRAMKKSWRKAASAENGGLAIYQRHQLKWQRHRKCRK
jgi:hypothetical protein